MFLDRSGRRRRLFVAAGSGGAALLLTATLGLVAAFTGASSGLAPVLPLLGDPAIATHRPPATTRPPVPPRPSRSGSAPAGSVPPSVTPSAVTSPPGSASPSPTGRRHVPTQTPTAHPSKKK